MEQFVLPLSAFDVTLLLPEARDPRSPAFRTALDDYFRQQFRTLRANGVVQITAETLSVGWITPGFQPVDAAIALCQRGQIREGVQLLELARTRTPNSPNLLLNLGIALNELREFPRAVLILEHMVDLHPDHPRAWVASAVALGHVDPNSATSVPCPAPTPSASRSKPPCSVNTASASRTPPGSTTSTASPIPSPPSK